MRSAQSKIIDRKTAIETTARLKREGEVVVLANGCFDTLHVGHVRYLAGAKREGDLLIVAVNSDESVKCLKGPGRPVLDEHARAQLVAALRDAHPVAIFAEPDVARLLEEATAPLQRKGQDPKLET